jgi:hypothetical protein
VAKRITLDVRDESGVVVYVTVPMPILGTLRTFRVAVADEDAREFAAKVARILDARGAPKRLGGS